MDAFTEAYVEAGLWSGLDIGRQDEAGNNPPQLDENYGPDDITDAAMAEIVSDCQDFQEANAKLLETAYETNGYDEAQAGHDFLLTRNRHGAGFWDRGLGDIGDKLTEAAHVYGDAEEYHWV